MAKDDVIIKSNQYGLTIRLNPELAIEELKIALIDKLKAACKFFKDAKVAVAFEGKKLSNDEEAIFVNVISDNSSLEVVCVLETQEEKEEPFKQSLEKRLEELSYQTGQFYKGTLRSGQILEVENSIIVIGDVNPGAKIISKGNIIILGVLKGTAYAGAGGNNNAFVLALSMQPMQIRIADIIARSQDKPDKSSINEPKLAFVENDNIYIEKLDKSVLKDINI